MPLHFAEAELADRRARTCAAMAEAGLDGLLCFRQESMFWLTGYDTFGYVYFQCLYLGADGTMTLLTRAPDLRQAQQTSVIGDIRIWIDRPDAGPAEHLRSILDEHVCRGKRLGATYAPNWMDWPMFFHGNPVEAAPGMVFFIHIVIFDSDAGLAMTTGQTVAVTAPGCEALTRASLDLVVK